MSQKPHLCVCICTYRRPDLLHRLLSELKQQETQGKFTYSIVVADNDKLESAKPIVTKFEREARIAIDYVVQPEQNIALTRNKAISAARGDFIVFIDDDEFPISEWLLTLFKTYEKYNVDGVLGPVKRYFDTKPPKWILQGDFYERPSYPTGTVIDWRKGRTGNVLLKKTIFTEDEPFRPEFRQGEDQDFFQRKIDAGYRFIWCDEAVAYEVVPPVRWKRVFMLKRALLRGAMEPKTADFGLKNLTKSIVAVPAYAVALPFAAVLGHHRFMKLLISLCDHLGKLLAVSGLNPIKDPYVTQ